jgi:hypothetical protein
MCFFTYEKRNLSMGNVLVKLILRESTESINLPWYKREDSFYEGRKSFSVNSG